MISVYVAAASAPPELERAERWIARLRELGTIEVVSTWPGLVRAHGTNPTGVARQDRAAFAMGDLRELRKADVLWLLAPNDGVPGRGAYFELGWAVGAGMTVVSSGQTEQSIFTALGYEFALDIDAFRFLDAKAAGG